MRIAVIFDNFGPYHVARLSAAAGRGDVVGIETAGQSGDYRWAATADTQRFVRRTLLPGKSADHPTPRIATAMDRTLAELRPDVIAIPGWHDRAGLSALRWAKDRNIPVIIMSDSNEDDAPRMWFREMIKRKIVSLCSTGFVAGSRAARYLERLGMKRDLLTVGYDTVDNAHFATGAAAAGIDAAGTRARLALPNRYFLACCRFVAKKNLPFLVAGYASYVKARGDDAWQLVLLGDGILRDDLIALVKKLGITESVHLPGLARYEDLPAYYGLAGGFVLASVVDQWGLVVNEAMAARLPVLVSRGCGSADDLVIDGDNGFVFDPTDAAALVGGFGAIAHGDGTARMGARSGEIIADWGLDRFADGLFAAARLAVERPSSAGAPFARATLGAMLR